MAAERSSCAIAISEMLEVATFVLDLEGRVVGANALARSLFPTLDPDNGEPLPEPLRGGSADAQHLLQLLEGRAPRAGHRVKLPGEELDRALLVEPLPGATPPRFLALLVSANVFLADRRVRADMEMRSLIESIIGGFAHEVRNPLASILSLTESAIEEWSERSLDPTDLMRIPTLVSRIERLLQQSLAYGRPKPPQKRVHTLEALFAETLQLLRPLTRGRLVLAPLSTAAAFRGDLQQLSQVLINLLENAADAAEQKIEVSWTEGLEARSGPVWRVEICDDGPGVPPELHKRIFDPFFTTKANGTGLGLAIARDLARFNGGDLVLASPRSPTRFVLTFPLARTARAEAS